MKNGTVTNREIRNYWWKVIRKSFSTVMERTDMKLGFVGVVSLCVIFTVAGFGLVIGLVPKFLFLDQLSNFSAGLVTFGGAIIVALIFFIATLYRTPAQLERNQESDFVKVVQNKNKELQQLRNETQKWAEQGRIPQSKEVAYETGLLIQDFETKFNEIRNGEIEEMENQFNSTRPIIDSLLDEKLPIIRLILKNADSVQENLYKMNTIRNQYGFALKEFIDLKKTAKNYMSTHSGYPPKQAREAMEKALHLLWGVDEKSYKVQMNSVIKNLLKNLRELS